MELMVGLYTHALSIISPFILKIEGYVFLFCLFFLIPILEIILICFSLYFQNNPIGLGKKNQCFIYLCQGRQTFSVESSYNYSTLQL